MGGSASAFMTYYSYGEEKNQLDLSTLKNTIYNENAGEKPHIATPEELAAKAAKVKKSVKISLVDNKVRMFNKEDTVDYAYPGKCPDEGPKSLAKAAIQVKPAAEDQEERKAIEVDLSKVEQSPKIDATA